MSERDEPHMVSTEFVVSLARLLAAGELTREAAAIAVDLAAGCEPVRERLAVESSPRGLPPGIEVRVTPSQRTLGPPGARLAPMPYQAFIA